MEHGNWPIFLTDFLKIVHILAVIGNRNTGGHWNFLFWQISNGYFETIGREIENHAPWEPPPCCAALRTMHNILDLKEYYGKTQH